MLTRGRRRWILSGAIVALAIGAVGSIAVWKSSRGRPWHALQESLGSAAASPSQTAAVESRIIAFCGNCHAMPSPLSFPRDAWHNEVLRGYEYYASSGLSHLDPPPVHEVVDYYRSRAPAELVFPETPEAATGPPVKFTLEKRTSDRHPDVAPAVAHLRWARLEPDGRPLLLACDMRDGSVAAVDPNDEAGRPRVLARLNNPCHVEPCDLDGNGSIDLVVADLGSLIPYDHGMGRIVWLRRDGDGGGFEQIVLASGLGRVADVRPGDLDADGDVDLVVAVFGMQRTGQVLLLENISDRSGVPKFVSRTIDPRPGAIHVPVVDLDGDGRLDFLGLISQEHECVEAYVNGGDDASGQDRLLFRRKRLWTGPDLTFGSSGIEPVDLDLDGDVDVLYTNGDAFDNSYVNPSHGVQWLENLDNERFIHHRLTDFVGVCRALAGDLDLDGDLDVVAVAWLPERIKPAQLRIETLASIVCLEQTDAGVFVRHTLERGTPLYPALELADFDGDGDLDFAVGSNATSPGRISQWLTVWRNELR